MVGVLISFVQLQIPAITLGSPPVSQSPGSREPQKCRSVGQNPYLEELAFRTEKPSRTEGYTQDRQMEGQGSRVSRVQIQTAALSLVAVPAWSLCSGDSGHSHLLRW